MWCYIICWLSTPRNFVGVTRSFLIVDLWTRLSITRCLLVIVFGKRNEAAPGGNTVLCWSIPYFSLILRSQMTWGWLPTLRSNARRSDHMSCSRGGSNSCRYVFSLLRFTTHIVTWENPSSTTPICDLPQQLLCVKIWRRKRGGKGMKRESFNYWHKSSSLS